MLIVDGGGMMEDEAATLVYTLCLPLGASL